MLVGKRILFPQPGTEPLAPSRSILVDSEFFRHGLTCFSKRGSRSFVSDLSQWGQIAANGEDDGSSPWKTGKSVMFNPQKGSQRIELDLCAWAVGCFDSIRAVEREKKFGVIALNGPLC